MPADPSYPLSFRGSGNARVYYGDGSSTGDFPFEGEMGVEHVPGTFEDVLHRGKRPTPRVAIQTEDAKTRITLNYRLPVFLGSSEYSVYEAFLFKGKAAGKPYTGAGDQPTFDYETDLKHGEGSGETHIFRYCVVTAFNASLPENGFVSVSATLECFDADHEITDFTG